MEQIAAAKIKIYEFPEVEDGEEAERKENRRMKVPPLFDNCNVNNNMIFFLEKLKKFYFRVAY